MAEPIEMDLATLCSGGVVEQFKDAMEKVAANIIDVNTDAEAKRQIVITATFVPDADRRISDVNVQTITKLAGTKGLRTLAYTKKSAHGASFIEQAPPEQQMLDVVSGLKPKVVEGGKK